MTTEKVTDLRWLTPDKSVLGGTIITDAGQAMPICIHADYDTEQGREIWDKAGKGDYGAIAEFVPPPEPTAEERRAAMPDLERWRMNAAIDLTPGLRPKIEAAIAELPEPKRTISTAKLEHVAMFKRTDPMFDFIGGAPSVGIAPEVIDEMWAAALKL